MKAFKPMRKSRSILLLFTGFLLCGHVHAQGQEKKQGIQFSCMLWNGPLPEKIYYQDGEDYREVVPYTSSRSLPHWLEKSKEFRLFTRKEVDQEDGKEGKVVYSLVGQAAMLPGVERILFILFPTKDEASEALEIRILALDDSLNGFPPGSFRFANFSASELFVKFAGVVKKIPSKEITLMKSGIGKQGGLVPFLIGDGEGNKVFETRLFAQASGREIVFIGPPKEVGGLPSVRFLPQLLPQKLPQKLP
jgi:hypothetical protein